MVAPVRERGLKSLVDDIDTYIKSRSREGAWIEIRTASHQLVRHRKSLP